MTQEATSTPAAPAIADLGTIDQRVAAIHESIRGEAATEAPPEPAAESGEAADPPAVATPKPAADSGSASDRASRLAALQAKERERSERRARQAEQDKIARELAEARKRADDAEAKAKSAVDLDSLDEAAFFRLAQSKGIKPERLGEWIRDAITSPEKVAEAAAMEAARKELTSKLSPVEQKLAALEQQLAEERAERARLQHEAAERAAAEQFFSFTRERASEAPYSARYLAQKGPEAFHAIALQAANLVPEGSDFQAVLDVVEQSLSDFAQSLIDQPKNAAPTPPKKSAAAKASTVSNAHAGERASVVDEDDWSSLPFEERVARMKASR